MMNLITIHTDHGPLNVPAGSTLEDALLMITPRALSNPHCVATAVNGQFVARGDRADTVLQDQDKVLCFTPITGG